MPFIVGPALLVASPLFNLGKGLTVENISVSNAYPHLRRNENFNKLQQTTITYQILIISSHAYIYLAVITNHFETTNQKIYQALNKTKI